MRSFNEEKVFLMNIVRVGMIFLLMIVVMIAKMDIDNKDVGGADKPRLVAEEVIH